MATTQNNLMIGSHGPEVSQLQQVLKQHGLYSGSIDGIYGNDTKQAVSQFQQMSGIKNDGIYGPQTTTVLDNWQQHPIKFAMSDPAIQQEMASNPNLKATLTAASENSSSNQANILAAANFMSKAAAAGGAPNPGYLDKNGNVAGDVFQQMALQQASPVINDSLKQYMNDFQQGVQNEKAQYAAKLANTQNTNWNNTKQFQMGEAQNGQVNNGAGIADRNNFYNTQQTGLNALQSGEQTTLSGLARNYESNLGTQALSDSGENFNIQGAGNIGKGGAYQAGGQTQAYSPLGGIQGALTAQWQSQVNNSANQMRNGAYPQTPAYDQYTAAAALGGVPTNYSPYGTN